MKKEMTVEQKEIQNPYAYFLDNVPYVGKKSIEKLLALEKRPDKIYAMSQQELKEVLTQKQIKSFLTQKETWELEKEYKKLGEKKIHFYWTGHVSYPKKLGEIPDRPFGIYVKGKLPEENKPSVAIVGARMCSEYGRYMARQYGLKLASSGIQIVSGLARGVDGISQKAAIMAGGNTYGVLGCGVDVCYPEENRELYNEVSKQGGLISEYVPGTMPCASFFPPRNRIINGLADVILVVEAKEKSGTLITVDMGLEQGKEIYAIPGRACDSLSYGCNHLIKQGAGIALSPEEFMEELCFYTKREREETGLQKGSTSLVEVISGGNYSVLEKDILFLLASNSKSLEELLEEYRKLPDKEMVSIPFLMQQLVNLQMRGVITQIGGNYTIAYIS